MTAKAWGTAKNDCADGRRLRPVGGECFYPAMAVVWVVDQNDRGGVGGAAPTVRVVEGWSLLNDGFNFWQNPPLVAKIWASASAARGGEGQLSAVL